MCESACRVDQGAACGPRWDPSRRNKSHVTGQGRQFDLAVRDRDGWLAPTRGLFLGVRCQPPDGSGPDRTIRRSHMDGYIMWRRERQPVSCASAMTVASSCLRRGFATNSKRVETAHAIPMWRVFRKRERPRAVAADAAVCRARRETSAGRRLEADRKLGFCKSAGPRHDARRAALTSTASAARSLKRDDGQQRSLVRTKLVRKRHEDMTYDPRWRSGRTRDNRAHQTPEGATDLGSKSGLHDVFTR